MSKIWRNPDADPAFVAALEAATLDSEGWMPVIELLMAGFDGVAGGINTVDVATGRVIAAGHRGMTARTEAEYYSHFIRADPRLPVLNAMPIGTAFSDTALLADTGGGNREFFAWEADQGFRGTLVFKLVQSPAEVAAIAITRRKDRAPPGSDTLAAASALAPRLADAAAINRRIAALEGLAGGLERALAAGARAFALFGPAGTLLHANAGFQAALDRRDGLAEDGLGPAVLAAEATGRPRALQIRRRGAGMAYRLVLQPVTPRAAETRRFDWGRHGAVLAFLDDPDADIAGNRSEVLQQIFGLTSAEARVAMLLAEGDEVEAIALRQGVVTSTVRSQLKSIFQKMGVNRQLGVARLVRGLPQFDG